ncbi:MAG: glutamate-cysteine ligase family protein [Gemmatimonadota bacterium]|nr:glutamate-cysteine ligase family protein [Gemmatimonadota bacterium]MDE2870573.1 glutamate-cysteine ligase family protein [Gemmatimonadota bacterium]
MGVDVVPERSPEAIRTFTRALLRDLQALERLLDEGLIETGLRRFGAEQELFLVDEAWRPAPVAVEVLEDLNDDPFTTELARFNLEANLSPRVLEKSCFSDMHAELDDHVARVREAARRHASEVILTGILPTLSKSDLSLDNITPRARYHALNEAMHAAGSGAFRLRIRGTDELMIEHDSVMLESCNTSVQIHLQVSAEEFAHFYNVAQAVTGPVLAACVNSPLLFGRRLWAETRIALFQQSLDTRGADLHMREMSPRVRFGGGWLKRSVAELFQEDIATFNVLLVTDIEEEPFAVLEAGGVPKLQALQLFNGTVYRWNRPCYGISNGKPHLRIECRALPSGPTTLDEMANIVMWIGTVLGVAKAVPDLTERMDFDDAKGNFMAASRLGLRSGMAWLDGESGPSDRLLLDMLLPLAREGLGDYPISQGDVDRYLGVFEERVKARVTGADWALRSFGSLKRAGTRSERLAALTASSVRQQKAGIPVVEWEQAELHEAGGWKHNYLRVEQYMTTSLTTVNQEELVEMVAYLMHVRQIRHVLIEDNEHRLVGIVSYRSILMLMSEGRTRTEVENMPVSEVMERKPVTVTPETPTLEAISRMRGEGVSALPVVKDGQLVGLVSETDYMPMAYHLLEDALQGD